MKTTLRIIHMISMVLVLLGALNWGLIGAFNFNLLKEGLLSRIVYIAIGLSAIMLAFHRTTYLPFLGPSVMPCSLLEDKTPPNATEKLTINITPNTKVLYWATEPATEGLKTIKSWREAYTYENAGVATSDASGKATLLFRNPQEYTVSFKGVLKPHVHYRVCRGSGWIGSVKTAFL